MNPQTRPEDTITIQKATGQFEAFSPKKLYLSLRACGADKVLARSIVDSVSSNYIPGSSTQDLRETIGKRLDQESRALAARYRLKTAIFDLGPAGYHFEQLVARLFAARGYRTETGVILQGKCVSHEVDVVANRDGERRFVECKFRTGPGIRCDVKTALYVHARSLDLANGGRRFDSFYLITNGKFTGDATQYAECVGLDLLGWDYPDTKTLPSWIEESQLYPVTSLKSLTPTEKQRLLDTGLLLCRDLLDHPEPLDALGMDGERREELYAETRAILAQPSC